MDARRTKIVCQVHNTRKETRDRKRISTTLRVTEMYTYRCGRVTGCLTVLDKTPRGLVLQKETVIEVNFYQLFSLLHHSVKLFTTEIFLFLISFFIL